MKSQSHQTLKESSQIKGKDKNEQKKKNLLWGGGWDAGSRRKLCGFSCFLFFVFTLINIFQEVRGGCLSYPRLP